MLKLIGISIVVFITMTLACIAGVAYMAWSTLRDIDRD